MVDGVIQGVGYVDAVVGNRISGWARSGDATCSVDLIVDGMLISATRADIFRQDLLGTVSADGKHGFIIVVPATYCDGEARTVEVRFSGSETLLQFGRFPFSHDFVYEPPVVVAKPHPKLALRAKQLLALLRPADVTGGRFVRRGRANDGGYVMLNHGLENVIAYSLGINDDVSWDMEMARAGCQLFQYDHTIDALPEQHPSFQWSRNGVAGSSSEDGVFKSIDDLICSNGHTACRDLILKMDIEGSEWELLNAIPFETLLQFSQIVAEFHSFTFVDGDEHYQDVTGALRKLNETHKLVHIHANNCGWLGMIGGVTLPDAFEVTYVRRNDHQFEECRRVFPTSIDMPCNPNAADYYLGAMGLSADP